MSRDKSWWKRLEPTLLALARRDSERLRGPRGEIDSCTLPLYLPKNRNGAPELMATGTLLSVGECVFLLTAAHAIEHFNKCPVILPIGGRLVGACGESYRTKLPRSGTHDYDPLDAAVLRIDGEERTVLRRLCLTQATAARRSSPGAKSHIPVIPFRRTWPPEPRNIFRD